jgi:hypothetical protein
LKRKQGNQQKFDQKKKKTSLRKYKNKIKFKVQPVKQFILNRLLVMCEGDFSQGDVSFKALTMSFLFRFPLPLLSRNKKTSIMVSKVASSCGEPSLDV